MKYKVGQVFYLVGVETAKVIPFRIVEEITRTTLEGEEKTYIAELPDAKKSQIPVLKLKGEIFDSLDALRTHMLNNAKQAIESMIDSAEKLSWAAYNVESKSPPRDVLDEIELPKEETVDSSEDSSLNGFEVLSKDDVETGDSVQGDEKSDIVKVDIGNGVMANMSIKDLEKVSQI